MFQLNKTIFEGRKENFNFDPLDTVKQTKTLNAIFLHFRDIQIQTWHVGPIVYMYQWLLVKHSQTHNSIQLKPELSSSCEPKKAKLLHYTDISCFLKQLGQLSEL